MGLPFRRTNQFTVLSQHNDLLSHCYTLLLTLPISTSTAVSQYTHNYLLSLITVNIMAWFAITSLMAATALARTAAAAYVPNCLWTVQLQDWSPLVHFDPAEQWSVAPVERTRATANGTDSSRTSKGSGAKMTFESPGTRFTAYGQLSNVSSTPLDFAVDGVAMNPPAIVNQSTGWTTGDIADDLAFGMHKITLELNPSNTNPDASFGVHRWTQLTGTVAET